MVCNKCGAQLPDDAVFCNNCGANVQQQPQMQQAQQPQMQQQQQVQYQYQQPVRPQVVQPKSKTGLAVGFIAATMFFLGMVCNLSDAISLVPLAVLVCYVLFKEEDKWLRKCAARVTGTVLIFGVLSVLVGIFFNLFDIFQVFASWGDGNTSFFYKLSDIESILVWIIRGTKNIFLLIMGIRAFSMKTTKMMIVDSLIEKYMN